MLFSQNGIKIFENIHSAVIFTRPYGPSFLYQTDMMNGDFATVALLKPFL